MPQSRPSFRPPPPPPPTPSVHHHYKPLTDLIPPPSPRTKFSNLNESIISGILHLKLFKNFNEKLFLGNLYRSKKQPPLSTYNAAPHAHIRSLNLNNGSLNETHNIYNNRTSSNPSKPPVVKSRSMSRIPRFLHSLGSKIGNLFPPTSSNPSNSKFQNQSKALSYCGSLKSSRAPPPPPFMINQRSQHCVPIIVPQSRTPPPLTPLNTERRRHLSKRVPPPPLLRRSKEIETVFRFTPVPLLPPLNYTTRDTTMVNLNF